MSNGSIPPPLYTEAPPTLGPPFPKPGFCFCFFEEYDPALGHWTTSPTFTNPWDFCPSGYAYAQFSYPGHPAICVVTARTRPDGSIAPNVLEYPNWTVVNDKGGNTGTGTSPSPQPPPPPTPNPECPPGFILITVSDPINFHAPDFGQNDDTTTYCMPVGPTWPTFQPQPNCPPGTRWDPTTETCKPIVILPPPECPPGTQWDPTTESCKPTKKKPPPVCPPGTVWDPFTETCKSIVIPPIPGQPCYPDPNGPKDELIQGLDCISENLIFIQQLLQQQQQGGETPQLDPVTCTQLSYLASLLDQSLIAIARAIQAAAGHQPPPINLTPITTALRTIARELQALVDKPDAIGTIPPSSTTTVDDRFGAFLSATLTEWVNDGTMTAADTQGLI